jgi:GT2 family glycosyltransferase
MVDNAVILSVYRHDRLDHLDVALRSLYVQSQAVDIFVQEDGPIPIELGTYLDEEHRSGRIVYLGKYNRNRGLATSLNELLEIVLDRGYSYIARMDADDISLPYRIKKQAAYLDSHPEVDVVGGYIEEFGEDFVYKKLVKYPLTHQDMFEFFAKRVPLAHVTAMYRDTYFQKAGLYPTSSPTNEDTLMWMKGFAQGCRFANIPEILVRVRVSESFFGRRGGAVKAWSDLVDRIKVINTLGYNSSSYLYALALFAVSIAPSKIKKILYERLR